LAILGASVLLAYGDNNEKSTIATVCKNEEKEALSNESAEDVPLTCIFYIGQDLHAQINRKVIVYEFS
jgi:hypothetical protein